MARRRMIVMLVVLLLSMGPEDVTAPPVTTRDLLDQSRTPQHNSSSSAPQNASDESSSSEGSIVEDALGENQTSGMPTNNASHNASTGLLETEVVGHSVLWWLWGSVLGIEGFVGFFWFRHVKMGNNAFAAAAGFAVLVNLIVQFAPLLAIPLRWANCNTGLPWLMHILFLLTLVLASPGLGHPFEKSSGASVMHKVSVPLLGLKGGAAAYMYLYVMTLLSAYDTYGDAMNVAIAYSCGWQNAWVMLAVFIYSLVLQTAAAAMMSGCKGALSTLVGSLPEKAMYLEEEGAVKFAATAHVWRLLTENIPQAALAIWFAYDLKPSWFVYLNIAVSLTLAVKSFVLGARRIAEEDYTPLE